MYHTIHHMNEEMGSKLISQNTPTAKAKYISLKNEYQDQIIKNH